MEVGSEIESYEFEGGMKPKLSFEGQMSRP